jgi:hypothetical protein
MTMAFRCPGEDPQAEATITGGSGNGGSSAGGGVGGSESGGSGGSGGQACSADLTTDPKNCGACGRACSPMGVVTPSCSGGRCNSTCAPDRVNLGQPPAPIPDDGCEGLGRRVFITSTFVPANMGSVAAGDAICQQRATAAGLGGMWRAWLSDAGASPNSRFQKAAVPYVMLNGSIVAMSYADLVSGDALGARIVIDELGADISATGSTEVWSGTDEFGAYSLRDCTGWTYAGDVPPLGDVGNSALPDTPWQSPYDWTFVYGQFCDRTNVRLYCFEQ